MIRDRHDTNANTYADLLGPGSTPAVARVVAALDAAGTPVPSPQAARLDAAMARTLYAQPTTPAHRHRLGAGIRRRVAPVATALALALGGLGAYLHGLAPTPVSAQSILRHTAAAFSAAGPDQATHDVFAVHTLWTRGLSTAGLTAADLAPDSTYDSWVQRDADSLRQFVIAAQGDANQDVRAFPQQTLDGSLVDVVQVSHTRPRGPQDTSATPRQYTGTLYVDAQTYAFRKLAMSVSDDAGNVFSGTVQSLRHEVVPLSDVPAPD